MLNVEQYIANLNTLTEAERIRIFHALIERYPEIKSDYIRGIDNLSDVERLKIFSTLITRPEIKGMLNGIVNSQTQSPMNANDNAIPAMSFGDPTKFLDSSANDKGGKILIKAIPGRADMMDPNQYGFSNYLLLAIFAFSIQFIVTLICILFYK